MPRSERDRNRTAPLVAVYVMDGSDRLRAQTCTRLMAITCMMNVIKLVVLQGVGSNPQSAVVETFSLVRRSN